MISISISCEESEIPGVMTLLSGVLGQSGVVTVPALTGWNSPEPAPKAVVAQVTDCKPVDPKPVDNDLVSTPKPGKVRDHSKMDIVVPKSGELSHIKSAWELSSDARNLIKRLHDEGKSLDEIKQATGIFDGRIIMGVLRRGKPHNHKPAELGVPATEVKPIYKAEAKKDAAEEHLKQLAELKPLDAPLDVIRRVLDLTDSKLTPKSISDTIEEEFGAVLSVSEIMDIIVRRSKGLLPQSI